LNEITSLQNPKIKEVYALQKRKNRDEKGLFLVEGVKGVYEALDCNIKFESIFVLKDSGLDIKNLPEKNLYMVSEPVIKKISTTESPPEVVAVCYQPKYSVGDLFKDENPLILVLESVKDPGNLGTIIRTSVACGVSGIILTDKSVDLYNPKTVRSSTGNLWKLPVINIENKAKLKEEILKHRKCNFVATVVQKDLEPKVFFDINYKQPTVLLFGSEAEGLSEELVNQSDEYTTIPMSKNVESLNLGISVGVILYECVKQRCFSKI